MGWWKAQKYKRMANKIAVARQVCYNACSENIVTKDEWFKAESGMLQVEARLRDRWATELDPKEYHT